MVLKYFALIIMLLLVAFVGFLAWQLGALPGRIARKRGHPQADAITACGWLGLITLGLLWPIAFVWAYTRSAPASEDGTALSRRIEALERQLRETQRPHQGGAG